MKIVNRYLMREVYVAMLATIVVLLFVFLSNVFVRYMHAAALGTISGAVVKILLLLQLPILSAALLPASLFLGILFAYGRFYADSEMTIFAVCGMNPLRLLTTTLIFSCGIMVVVAILSFWFNPKVYKYSDHLVSGAVTDNFAMVKTNHFNEIADGKWIFYVESMSEDKKYFYNVFAAGQPTGANQNGSSVITAKQAYQRIDQASGDTYIIFVDGYRYTGVPGQRDYEVIKYDEYGIQIPSVSNSWRADESSISTVKLWQDRGNNLVAAELHWRLALPLSALILTLIAVPLSKIQPKKGRYAKLAPAVLLYIIYANFLFLSKAWVKRGVLSPVLGMWWVHGLMVMVAIVLIGGQLGWWQKMFGRKI